MKKLTLGVMVAVYFISPVWAEEARTQKTLSDSEQAFRKADICL